MRMLLLLFAATLAAPLSAAPVQEDDEDKEWLEDPYTKDDPEAWKAAGYVDRDRFRWADGHGTNDIDTALGGEEVIWVETEHFRIGVSLPEYTIDKNSKEEKEKIRAELKRLKEIIPKVPTKPKKLDKWLQVHLWAMRAEDLYDEVEELLGVPPEGYPSGPGQTVDGKYMGEGPYLGMADKYTILLFEKESSLGRYRNRFMPGAGGTSGQPIRHLFPQPGVLLFGCARENPGLSTDTTMHCMFVYSVTMNLINGYKYYSHEMPAWFPTGLGHWMARRISLSRNYFTEDRLFDTDDKDVWDWEPRARARVEHEISPRMSKVFEWDRPENMKYTEHMMAWARVDHLLKEHKEGIAVYMDRMAGRIAGKGKVVTREVVLEVQPGAFEEAFGVTPAEMDALFDEWVLDNYRKK